MFLVPGVFARDPRSSKDFLHCDNYGLGELIELHGADLFHERRRLFVLGNRTEGRQQGLVARNNDRAVLEKGALNARLGAADQLSASGDYLSLGRALETGPGVERRDSVLRSCGALSVSAQGLNRADQGLVHTVIRRAGTAECAQRDGHSVGQLCVMQDCPATRGSSDQVDPESGGLIRVIYATSRLITPE
jgi:hypothetical protein